MFGVRFSSSTSSSNYPLEITALTVVSPISGDHSKLQHIQQSHLLAGFWRALPVGENLLLAASFVKDAGRRGVKAFICGAGGAAHLAGAVAAHTTRPVIGIPVVSGSLGGLDSLLSTVQMPPGMPVATVAIGGAENAGLLAAQIIAVADPELGKRVEAERAARRKKVLDSDAEVRGAKS